MRRVLLMFVLVALTLPRALGETLDYFASAVAAQIDPVKLKTLGVRKANPRVQRVTYWLESARRDGKDMRSVADAALGKVKMSGAAAQMTRDAMLRNQKIAESLGCFDVEGMSEMRRGKSPTVRRGPYAGDQLSVDHIVPRAVCPELDNVIANLELMPMRMNASKNDKVGARQLDVARKLNAAGLVSANGVQAVVRASVR